MRRAECFHCCEGGGQAAAQRDGRRTGQVSSSHGRSQEHGTDIPYEGALLHDVLERAGALFGNDLRGKALSSYVLAIAQDGYQVVYTLNELDPAFVDSQILIADRSGGKPLSEKQGPFRIVVPGEKKPARSLRMLERIEVRNCGSESIHRKGDRHKLEVDVRRCYASRTILFL